MTLRDRERTEAERTRRRFVRRQWTRRWLAWRYVIASVLLVALVAGSIWLVFLSSVLTVKKVTVHGEQTLSERHVLAAAGVPVGEPLATLDLAAITARVKSLAKVRTVDVSRDWPDGVLITITERTPVAVVDMAGQLRAMDRDGVLFESYDRAPAGLPRVVAPDADTSGDALREAARVVAALPGPLSARVDHVQVETVDRISLVLHDGRVVDWGSADQSATKARVLVALLKHPAHTYDVSVPGSPTTTG